LGNLRLRYIELERAFLAQGGREALWHARTGLHNEAMNIIDRELGRDYWAQFKDVKLQPLVVPAGFPSDDAKRVDLLYMIHGRSDRISPELACVENGMRTPGRRGAPELGRSDSSHRLPALRSCGANQLGRVCRLTPAAAR